jgi:uncharacterized protein YdbL (DUF1318 family)
MILRVFIAATAVLTAAAGAAQSSDVAGAAIQAGQVGERYDGYLGFVRPPSEPVRRAVSAINIRRRNLYLDLASRRNVTADLVGLTAGCELLAQLPVGTAYMLKDGAWRTRAPGQPPPVPAYCR